MTTWSLVLAQKRLGLGPEPGKVIRATESRKRITGLLTHLVLEIGIDRPPAMLVNQLDQSPDLAPGSSQHWHRHVLPPLVRLEVRQKLHLHATWGSRTSPPAGRRISMTWSRRRSKQGSASVTASWSRSMIRSKRLASSPPVPAPTEGRPPRVPAPQGLRRQHGPDLGLWRTSRPVAAWAARQSSREFMAFTSSVAFRGGLAHIRLGLGLRVFRAPTR